MNCIICVCIIGRMLIGHSGHSWAFSVFFISSDWMFSRSFMHPRSIFWVHCDQVASGVHYVIALSAVRVLLINTYNSYHDSTDILQLSTSSSINRIRMIRIQCHDSTKHLMLLHHEYGIVGHSGERLSALGYKNTTQCANEHCAADFVGLHFNPQPQDI